MNYTGSMSEQIRLLSVGQCCCKAVPLDFGPVVSLSDIRASLRNSLSSAIVRARASTGGTYSIEISEASMPSGAIYCVAVITRTA